MMTQILVTTAASHLATPLGLQSYRTLAVCAEGPKLALNGVGWCSPFDIPILLGEKS